jgi:hypothetical protein
MTLPKVNEIAPESQVDWYKHYWLKVGFCLGAGFLLALAGVLYLVVTRPIVAALGH